MCSSLFVQFLEWGIEKVSLKPPPTTEPERKLRDLVKKIVKEKIDHAVVVGSENRVLGSINIFEIMRIILFDPLESLDSKTINYTKRNIEKMRENSSVADLLRHWKNKSLSEVCIFSRRGGTLVSSTSPLIFIYKTIGLLKDIVSPKIFKKSESLIATNTTLRGVLKRAVKYELTCFLVHRRGNILGVVDCFDILNIIAENPEEALHYTCSSIYKKLEEVTFLNCQECRFSPVVRHENDVYVISERDIVREICRRYLGSV
ncbi:MAG: hypothetical protein DRN04_14930 [Thermoprotei archaeon]|nr:MAG: hypothetical protein DRN04_14930 [Thermoprotei archaeon]